MPPATLSVAERKSIFLVFLAEGNPLYRAGGIRTASNAAQAKARNSEFTIFLFNAAEASAETKKPKHVDDTTEA